MWVSSACVCVAVVVRVLVKKVGVMAEIYYICIYVDGIAKR
jgi:hypothetical protein